MQNGNRQFVRLQWLIWIILFLISFLYVVEAGDPVAEAFNYSIHCILAYVSIVYINALWLMPRLYSKGKYFLYVASVVLLLVSVTILRVQSWSYFWFQVISTGKHDFVFANYIYTFLIHAVLYVSSVAFRYTIDFFKIKAQQDLLLKEHAEAQLNLLKAQVQPHFLFNTLNNIYYVARQESPQTADLLEKLSFIIRFFLDQGAQEKICLNDELNFIRDYIRLEEIRMRYPMTVSIQITGDPAGVMIPPMLLIPLVENVFKHGIDKTRTDNFIDLEIVVSERFEFRVANALRPADLPKARTDQIGLRNLTERLEILYSGNFSLRTNQTEGRHTGILNIPYATN